MRRYLFTMALIVTLALMGCVPKNTASGNEKDNPARHYNLGVESFDKGVIPDARGDFDAAVALERGYAPGLAGQALVIGAAIPGLDEAKQEAGLDNMRNLLGRAERKCRNSDETLNVLVLAMRAETLAGGDTWLKRVREHYETGRALSEQGLAGELYYKTKQALDYHMGKAYFVAGEFKRARGPLGRLLADPPGRWHQSADSIYEHIQTMERLKLSHLSAGLAWRLLGSDSMTKAEACSILQTELGSLLDRPEVKGRQCGVPVDVTPDTQYREAILKVLAQEFKGIEAAYDPSIRRCRFSPESRLTRKELAMLLSDLIARISGGPDQTWKFLDHQVSPYPDVPPYALWYQPVVTVVNKGLMQVDIEGNFHPSAPVAGVDYLTAIIKLRNASLAK